MLYTATTFKLVFDYHPDDVYWCTADIGWITGHSYITYGPLANGATSVLVSHDGGGGGAGGGGGDVALLTVLSALGSDSAYGDVW